MVEEWRSVAGYEGSYEVSNTGAVRSLDREIEDSLGRISHHKGRVLRPSVQKDGLYVGLGYRGHSKTVHSLVATAFIGPRPTNYEVRFLDGDKSNANVSNLRYGPKQEKVTEKQKAHCKILNQFQTPESRQKTLEKSWKSRWAKYGPKGHR